MSEARRELSSITGRPTRSPSRIGDEDRRDSRQRVVEHRHLDEEALDPIRMANRQLERDVGAERGTADDRPLQSQVIEQREHLLGEERHRVEAQVVRLVGAPMAEQVEADHPVAALRQRRPQSLEHAAIHQQAMDEDDRAIAIAVFVEADPVSLVAQLAHRRHQSKDITPKSLS